MGAVYRAVHRKTGVAVAIKVILQGMNQRTRNQFHREVQAHAALVHPGIVYLFEYGEIPDGETDGELGVGRSFVAMELADRGTVRDALPCSSWEQVYALLVQTLDALAYAHARGVIHRDLKPENLLLFDENARFPHVKLADFGIAHAVVDEANRATRELMKTSGTPRYMAPEQVRGRWRQYGPWTDLYSLGCIAWELVCGRPPYQEQSPVATMAAHELQTLPALDPQFPVPEGLEAWIRRATAVDLRERFQRAADAARRLDALTLDGEGGEYADSFDDGDRRVESTGTDLEFAPTLAATRLNTDVATAVWQPDERATVALEEGESTPIDALGETFVSESTNRKATSGRRRELASESGEPISIPRSWKVENHTALPTHLIGTGLGLFGLRETPFVDRDRERDCIWDAICAAHQTQNPRVVLLEGAPGAGKSRLVEWMATRADELGAVRVIRSVHTSGSDRPNEGFAGMVRQLVRGHKLTRGEFYEYLLEKLPRVGDDAIELEADARALTELVYPTEDDAKMVDGPRYRFSSTAHKCAALARLIRRYARRRLPLMWLDDAQWSDLSMAFMTMLLDNALGQFPAVFLVTLRSDVIAEDESLRQRIDGWRQHERCIHLQLESLSEDDHRQFVEAMLPLENDLVEVLADRTEGNPLFAAQLLRSLVDKEKLQTGPEGFRLPEDESLELPEDVHELWVRRLERIVDDTVSEHGDAVWQAIEMTACLGREVGEAEWRQVCTRWEIKSPEALVGELVVRGLAERTERGWAFVHGLLVDSIERRARRHQRWKAHHRRCVDLLEQMYPERRRQTAERRAEHCIKSGQLERALEPLLQEASRLREVGKSPENRREVLGKRSQLLDEVGVSPVDPRRIENDIELIGTDFYRGKDPGGLLAEIEDAAERASRSGCVRLLAKAHLLESICHRQKGNRSDEQEAARRAIRLGADCEDDTIVARTLLRFGWSKFIRGRLDDAETHLSRARSTAERAGDRYRKLHASQQLGWVVMSRGEESRAREIFEAVLEEALEAGFRNVEMECLNGLGEIARFDGDAKTARERYRRYGQLARESIHRESIALSYLNLGQVELMAGRFGRAHEQLQLAGEVLEGADHQYIDLLNIADLTLQAGLGEWEQFDAQFTRYDDGWPTDARLEKDNPWLLQMAGDYAAEHGEDKRACSMWTLAERLWRRLGNDEAAARVAEKRAASVARS